jgi:hypothetical protein
VTDVKRVTARRRSIRRRNSKSSFHLVRQVDGEERADDERMCSCLGSRHEQQIRFAGESNQVPNADPGDVIVVLQQQEHDTFQRNGDDLIMKHKINLVESLCGFQLSITHLDGRKVLLTHAANDPIAPGRSNVDSLSSLTNVCSLRLQRRTDAPKDKEW